MYPSYRVLYSGFLFSVLVGFFGFVFWSVRQLGFYLCEFWVFIYVLFRSKRVYANFHFKGVYVIFHSRSVYVIFRSKLVYVMFIFWFFIYIVPLWKFVNLSFRTFIWENRQFIRHFAEYYIEVRLESKRNLDRTLDRDFGSICIDQLGQIGPILRILIFFLFKLF